MGVAPVDKTSSDFLSPGAIRCTHYPGYFSIYQRHPEVRQGPDTREICDKKYNEID
jgi:hypothetical protein